MAVLFNTNAAHNMDLREETVEWLGASFTPEVDGIYYTRNVTPGGQIHKTTTEYKQGKWHLGSGELAGIKVFEWMRSITN